MRDAIVVVAMIGWPIALIMIGSFIALSMTH